MQTTHKYGLKKPEANDFYNIEDFNENADLIEAALMAHDESLLKKAPAGYGLGGSGYTELTSETDLNRIWEAGWYYWNDAPQNGPCSPIGTPLTYCCMRVDSVNHYGVTQTIFRLQDPNAVQTRQLYAFTPMTDWEWVNPPMVINAEYRTTERYLGKPVYVKLVNIPALGNKAQVTAPHGISDIEYCISVSGATSDGYNLLGHVDVTAAFCGKSQVAIKSSADLTSASANVLLKYTKTT